MAKQTPKPKPTRSQAFVSLQANINEVTRLLQIHTHLSGSGPGRKFEMEVLNKSALILACAAWEAFNEDIILEAVDLISSNCIHPNNLPNLLRTEIAETLKKQQHDHAVWSLAGDGWRDEIRKNANQKLKKKIGSFNTPKAAFLKDLYHSTLGFEDITYNWYWPKTTTAKAISRLDGFVTLRGEIAHRVKTVKPVTKKIASDFTDLIRRLAIKIQEALSEEIRKTTGSRPWKKIRFGTTSTKRAHNTFPPS